MSNNKFIKYKRLAGLLGSLIGSLIGVVLILIAIQYLNTNTIKGDFTSTVILVIVFSISVFCGVFISNKLYKKWVKKL